MSGSVPLKTKDELREYLASAELQEVLRQTLSTILKRDDLPSATALVRVLGEELVSISEEAAAADEEDAEADEEEQRRIMAMRGKRRTGVSAESTSTMQTQEKPTVEGTEKTSEQKVRIEKAIDGNLLFEGIGGAQKEQLFQLMFEKTLEAGVNVITQGEEGDNFYVLDSGTCDIFVDGKEVASATDGDSFGELALMYSAPRAATVTTTSQVSLWAMDRITFRSMLFEKANAKREQYKEFLSSVKLLEPMEAYEREKIADVLETVEFADGEAVISEGEEGDTFFIVVEGTAAATKLVDGVQKEVKSYKAGDFFGELALIKDQPRAATVVAKGALTCASLGRKPFTRLVGPCDDILARNQELYDEINAQLGSGSGDAEDGVTLETENETLRAEVARLTNENIKLAARVAELEVA